MSTLSASKVAPRFRAVQGRASARRSSAAAPHNTHSNPIELSRHRASRVCAAASASVGVVAAIRSDNDTDSRTHWHTHTIVHRRGSCVTVRASDVAAAPAAGGDDASSGKKMSTFYAGILWFFAHQLIGVGNDVIMKYTGSTLGVAQVVF
jgi:hypothetical protein